MLKAYDKATGKEIKAGDIVINFRGESEVFEMATRAGIIGKSGKIVVDGVERYENGYGLIVKEELQWELNHLKEEIEKLNAPTYFEDEKFDSLYDFEFKQKTNSLLIYDRNEQFNINMDEETRSIVYEASKEFGFEYKTPESTEERIIGVFKAALEKDLGKQIVIEWQDSVCLFVHLG